MSNNQPNGKKLIVLFEDWADARNTLRMVLELHGYRVETARDGETGLDALLTCQPV